MGEASFLQRNHVIHAGGDGDQLRRHQSQEGAGPCRNRARIFDYGADAADHGDDKWAFNYGRQGKRDVDQCTRLADDGADLCGLGVPRAQLPSPLRQNCKDR